MLKEGSKIYVPKTGLTLELKSEDFMKELYAKGEYEKGKYTAVSVGNLAVEEGWAEVISE